MMTRTRLLLATFIGVPLLVLAILMFAALPPTLAEQSQLGANAPPFFSTESTVEPRYIGLSSTSYSTGTLTQTVYLPCVLSNYTSGSQPPPPINNPPNPPSNPSPSDGATSQSVNVDLSWTGGDPDSDSVTYDVYFEAGDSTPDVLVCNDVTSASCDPGTLSYATHYWQVVARDSHGATTTGLVWDFTTCSDQDPGDLSRPGVPTSTTRYDSPDIKEIVVSEPENFDVFEKEMHGKLVTFAVAKDFEMVDLPREEFSEFVFKTWAIFWKEFGGFPFASYTVVLGHELPYGDMGAFGLGFQSSSPRTDWASHEIYHAWNGNAFRQDGERMWFVEGVTYYYGDTRQQLFLVEPTYPLVMQSLYRRFINDFAPEYHEIPLGDMSMNDDDYNHSFVAHKGALVAYLLDLELQKTGHHLGEVARLIYQRYGIESLGIMTNDKILAVFNEVSGADFTDFFDRYIYGTEALPLSEDTDFEWVCHD
jgi:hypothetical protein